jgi:prevent-host-death family protein
MREITQRELRNDNAQIIREVEQGETFVVTRHGVPVARVTPIATGADLRRVRAAKPGRRMGDLTRIAPSRPTSEVLDDLRGER